MNNRLRLAQFVSIMLVALVAGLLWGTWFPLSRSIGGLSAQTYLEVGRTMIGNIAGPARIVFPLSLASVLVVAGLLWLHRRTLAFWLAASSAALLLATLVITVAVEVPIDNQTKTWTLATLPPDWRAIRDRWELFHTLRTFAALGSLGALVASSLLGSGLSGRRGRRSVA
jgi:uncharacterized membrane protein